MSNPYKIGDILYNSWGVDQTNIDWYEVVKVTPKSVKLTMIEGAEVETSSMVGTTTPRPGVPVEQPWHGQTLFRVGPKGELNFRYGSGSKWDGKPKRYSCYA